MVDRCSHNQNNVNRLPISKSTKQWQCEYKMNVYATKYRELSPPQSGQSVKEASLLQTRVSYFLHVTNIRQDNAYPLASRREENKHVSIPKNNVYIKQTLCNIKKGCVAI